LRYFNNFSGAIRQARRDLLDLGEDVDAGRWQGVPTLGRPDLITRELLSWGMSCHTDQRHVYQQDDDLLPILQDQIQPNLPWADDHFDERVSRVPSNPGEAYDFWPWWRGQYEETAHAAADEFKFSHTYQERFWPKKAGDSPWPSEKLRDMHGIRYPYGDLDDVVTMLFKDPYTRQAYLPIFFPEDTGAVHGGRIPCTLGYQFLLRNGKLHLWYFIRSCDYVRHFRDDIYLAARLQLWVIEQLVDRELRSDMPQLWVDVDPGYLHMLICSLHYHRGDEHLVRQEVRRA
jgi:hypothetical protein